jgi:hypothetical protein
VALKKSSVSDLHVINQSSVGSVMLLRTSVASNHQLVPISTGLEEYKVIEKNLGVSAIQVDADKDSANNLKRLVKYGHIIGGHPQRLATI